jgi:hypothetical protein
LGKRKTPKKSQTYKEKRPVNGRRKRKYPGLEKGMNLKIRWELIDQDYINSLSDKDKEWLNNFMQEYVIADFRHKGKVLHKNKGQKRECYRRNNARNRCVYGLAMARGDVMDEGKNETAIDGVEDAVIDMIDSKKVSGDS